MQQAFGSRHVVNVVSLAGDMLVRGIMALLCMHTTFYVCLVCHGCLTPPLRASA